MALETPVWLEAVSGDATILYSAREMRTWIDAIFAVEGVCNVADLKVAQRAAGANMSVDVAAGLVCISGDSVAAQGKYVARNTAVYNVAITANTGGSTRNDIIVARLFDKQADGGTQYSWNIVALAGTLVVPPSAVLLAQIAVAPGAASIANSAITDKRTLAQMAGSPKPAMQVGFSGSLNLPAGSLWTPVSGGYSAGMNRGGMTFTAAGVKVPITGPYLLNGMAYHNGASPGGQRGISYLVNNADVSIRGQAIVPDGGAAGTRVPAPGLLMDLNAGDVVNVQVYTTAPGAMQLLAAALNVHYIG